MPLPRTIRVNPLDLQGNIAIGISLPFSKPFNSTYSTKNQIKSNLLNLLLTSIGERVMNPSFGTNLQKYVFEGITDENSELLINDLQNSINIFIPEITIIDIVVDPDTDNNLINLIVKYILNISQTPDQIIVQF